MSRQCYFPKGQIVVYSVNWKRNALPFSFLKRWLSREEQRACNGKRRHSDRMRFLWGRVMLRALTPTWIRTASRQLAIDKEEKGKPFLTNAAVEFNLSHAGDWVSLALSSSPVGIDIEVVQKRTYWTQIAHRYFSENEVEWLFSTPEEAEQLQRFAQIWTQKEAYVKATGVGLMQALSEYETRELSLTEPWRTWVTSQQEKTPWFARTFQLSPKMQACVVSGSMKQLRTYSINAFTLKYRHLGWRKKSGFHRSGNSPPVRSRITLKVAQGQSSRGNALTHTSLGSAVRA